MPLHRSLVDRLESDFGLGISLEHLTPDYRDGRGRGPSHVRSMLQMLLRAVAKRSEQGKHAGATERRGKSGG